MGLQYIFLIPSVTLSVKQKPFHDDSPDQYAPLACLLNSWVLQLLHGYTIPLFKKFKLIYYITQNVILSIIYKFLINKNFY
jgi:hypothetical protein